MKFYIRQKFIHFRLLPAFLKNYVQHCTCPLKRNDDRVYKRWRQDNCVRTRVTKANRRQAVEVAVKPPKKSSNTNTDEAESESEEIAKPKGGWKTTQSGAKKLPAERKLDTSDDDDTSEDYDTIDGYDDLNLSDDNVEVKASCAPGRDKSKKRTSTSSSSSGEDYTEQLSKLNEHIAAFNKIRQEKLEIKRRIREMKSSRKKEEFARFFKKN